MQEDSGVGHSRETLGMGTSGTLWGWALQALGLGTLGRLRDERGVDRARRRAPGEEKS